MKLTLRQWQQTHKDIYSLIVQSSCMDGSDSWTPFPIGMSWRYGQQADKSRIQFGSHDKTALCAFHPTTDARRRPTGRTRATIINTVAKNGFPHVHLESADYFLELPNYKFVFSPEGNGIDCHRHYEALLAGCIPVIEDNLQVRQKYAGCPVLYTTDYSECTSDYLDTVYATMLDTTYDFSRLFLWFYTKDEQTLIKRYGNRWIPNYYKTYTVSNDYFAFIRGTPIVWITIINKGYTDFTQNFLKSMSVHKCQFTLVVYCLDKESIDALSGYSNAVCFDASEFINGKYESEFTRWGMLSYKQIVFTKLDAIRHTIALCKNYGIQGVGYIDTDIIVLKNPTPIILNAMTNPDVDIFHQCDECENKEQFCTNKDRCPNMCSGVIVFRTATTPITIFEYTSTDVGQHMSDQDYLVKRIDTAGLRRLSISRHIFLNGVYPSLDNNDSLILPEEAALIHFNCMVGYQKKHNMARKGFWY